VPAWGDARGALWQRAMNGLTFLLLVGWRLWRDHRELYGVISTTNPPLVGVAACLIQWLVGLPYLALIHDLYPDVVIRIGLLRPDSLLASGWARLTRLLLTRAAGVVVLGRDMEQLVRSKLNAATHVPVTVIPH